MVVEARIWPAADVAEPYGGGGASAVVVWEVQLLSDSKSAVAHLWEMLEDKNQRITGIVVVENQIVIMNLCGFPTRIIFKVIFVNFVCVYNGKTICNVRKMTSENTKVR